MEEQKIFKRYELKYLLTKQQYQELLPLIHTYMEPDKYGEKTICNIYYDTPDKRLIRRSLEKPMYKEKLRVRSYNVATKDSTVYVELKKKYDGVVYKRRIGVLEQEATQYFNSNAPLPNPSQITKEIDYFRELYKTIQPAVYLCYDRAAYFSITDPNFRMTFDENILFRDYDISLLSKPYGIHLLSNEQVLLEVKTGLGLPSWLLNFFSTHQIYKTSFSKYGTAYQNHLLTKKTGGNIYVA